MKNIEALRKRFMQDPISVRLGGLAANFSRIASFGSSPKNKKAIESMIEESKFFIEWTVPETPPDTQAFLVELQIKLALWQINRPDVSEVAKEAGIWSNLILASSGLLS